MGYSMAVSCRTVGLARKLAEFLRKNLAPLSVVLGGKFSAYDPTQHIRLGVNNEMAYSRGSTKIGFDYTGGQDTVQYYMLAVLRWAAIRCGKYRRYASVNGSFPTVEYDGREQWPVLVRGTISEVRAKKLKQPLVDNLGMHPAEQQYPAEIWPRVPQDIREDLLLLEQLLRVELSRLDILWQASR